MLSSGSEAYRQTLGGFAKEWGTEPRAVLLTETRKLPRAEIYLAFGAKAALLHYPQGATLIYWAPGLGVRDIPHTGPVVKVWLTASPAALLSGLRNLQPGLGTLRTFYISPCFSGETEKLGTLAGPLGVKILAERLTSPEDLPGRLRAMQGKPDAILVLYDPQLINAQNFAVIKNYSHNNRVPLYAPTAGLAEYGAAASLGPTFTEVGRTMAVTAKKQQLGPGQRAEVYPEVLGLTINLGAAKVTGLALSPAVLKTAAKVYP